MTLLEAPITVDDISTAISQLAASKAPGSDGLPLEFYATYSEIFIPKLHNLYQFKVNSDSIPSTVQEAKIIVILKPGKDPCYPD